MVNSLRRPFGSRRLSLVNRKSTRESVREPCAAAITRASPSGILLPSGPIISPINLRTTGYGVPSVGAFTPARSLIRTESPGIMAARRTFTGGAGGCAGIASEAAIDSSSFGSALASPGPVISPRSFGAVFPPAVDVEF